MENNEEKSSKKGKKIGIIIAVIVLVLIALAVGVGLFINYHKTQIDLLNEESLKILNLEIAKEDGTLNENVSIDMDIKTSGGYAVVEKTLKDYLNEVIELAKDATTVYNTEEIDQILNIENIKNDGPDFVETKAKIAKMKSDSKQYIEKFISLCDENRLLSAIDDKDVSDYYKEVYRKVAADENTKSELEKSINEIKQVESTVDKAYGLMEKLVNFLSDNKASWQISNDQIVFKSQSALDEFNKILAEAENL